MKQKRLFWLIPGFIVLMAGAFLLFRYSFLPSVPKENPVEITAVYSTPDGNQAYYITDPGAIDTVMQQLRPARVHRKLVQVRYLGSFFIFREIRFQYEDRTYIYEWMSGRQFHLYAQENSWRGPLYEVDSETYGEMISCLRQICEIPS